MIKKLFVVVCLVMLVGGCLGKKTTVEAPQPFVANDLSAEVKSGQLVQTLDNFLILFDASGSMSSSFQGKKKILIANEIADRLNKTIPEMDITGGMRTFGQSISPFGEQSQMIYGMAKYQDQALDMAIKSVTRSGGNSPLELALGLGTADLKKAKGSMAVIVISDGMEMNYAPAAAAEKMKAEYGDRICIYTILVGDNAFGNALLTKIADAGKCGFTTNAADIDDPAGMAGFVRKVFFDKDTDKDGVIDTLDKCPGTPQESKVDADGCPLDTDGDGVYDYLDKCPGTKLGVKVDAVGCSLDTDGDGATNDVDKCPTTPAGAKVNTSGCWILANVLFDTGRWSIKDVSYSSLDEAVKTLKENPGIKVEVQGHTDSVGSYKYNKRLSQNRANSVMKYFIKKGVDKSRLTATGYGPDKPVASNSSAEGRAKNRRVALQPVK